MKTVLILLALAGTQSISASMTELEKTNKETAHDVLIKKDLLIETEIRPSRVSRMGREVRTERKSRPSRVVHMGKNSKNIRLAREVRHVHITYVRREVPTLRLVRLEREDRNVKISTIIKKDYIAQLLK